MEELVANFIVRRDMSKKAEIARSSKTAFGKQKRHPKVAFLFALLSQC